LYLTTTLMFSALLTIAVLMASAKRRRLVQRTRTLQYRVGEQVQNRAEQ
jgi:hypothetical protein